MELNDGTRVNYAFEKENGMEETSNTIIPSSKMDEKSKKTTDLSEEERLLEIRSIQKNLVSIFVCGLLVTTPMFGLINSASSLLEDEGLGITSLAASSITQFLGITFLLSYVNKIFGVRRMISVSLMLPIPFVVSFAFPSWGTTLPGGILFGLGQGFQTSMFMYGNALGYYYAQLTQGNSDAILVVISGIMASCVAGGLLFGNAVVYSVLNIGLDHANYTLSTNVSYNVCGANSTLSTTVSYNVCGANYCNEKLTNLPTMKKPESWRYYTLVGLFTAMSMLGGIASLFIRDFSKELGLTLRKKSEYLSIMKETLGLLKRPRGFLLVIMTVFIGLEEAFAMADFTCSIGIPKVGIIMLSFGGVQVVICMSQGLLVKMCGRQIVIIFGVIMMLSCCLAVYLWHPNSSQVEMFFLLTVLWAAADGVIVTTFFAMYGILFEDNIEGSLSLVAFWWSLGFMIAFVWSQLLCTSLKLFITMSSGIVGLVCYLILEILLWKKSKKTTVQLLSMNMVMQNVN